MDLTLSVEQEAVRKLAEDFVAREVAPHAVAWDRAENIDKSIVKKLGDLGFLGLTVPEEYGGSGGDHLSYCLVTEELGRGDSSVRGIVSVSLGLVAKTVASWGSEEQKRRWLPRLTAGEAIGCFGLTEPGTGSDAGNLATRAVRDGGDYVVNGTKMFITNGTWADVVLLFARTNDAPGHRGVSAFLVPTDTPGLTRRTLHGKLGLRGQATAELVLQDVRIPAGALLDPRARASPSPCPPWPRGGCPWRRAAWASHRRPWTRPCATPVSANSSARSSPATSSSRNCSATSPWTWTPPGC